ncbi:DUF2841 domain-containing protein [Aspergillus melleus]|uniref:DUF2841 domain-containing protein n=1 Tax=Aspergillus melleus TaxID=138277 RepID=UPI001E8E7C62|nr:uncharacterized protein LDX57_012675 [Aspergillus melleus]KAH8435046.1 hypothetical protein LDX57_012675 [Aspergillus melleus]
MSLEEASAGCSARRSPEWGAGKQEPALPGLSEVALSHGYEHSDLSHEAKRQKISIQDPVIDAHGASQDPDSAQKYPSTHMVSLEIRQGDKISKYYEDAFKSLTMANCARIAKCIIRHIEPSKQAKHPYNGGKNGDPEKSKPEWWPDKIPHKDPHHLGKIHLIPLLAHIFRKLGYAELEQVTHETRKPIASTQKIQILCEILNVRRMQELYEQRQIDGTELVSVRNQDANQKGRKGSDSINSFK